LDSAGKVFADVPEFSSDVKKKIAENKLRYISVEIFENDKVTENEPPYLRAVALLGRDTPAVQGTKLPTLFSRFANDGFISVDDENHIATFTKKLSGDEMKSLSFEREENTKDTQEVIMDKEMEKLKADMAAQQAELAAFKKENAELKTAEKKALAEAFFSKLRDEGKLTPSLFDKAVALDAKLGDAERTELRAMFSELNAKVDLSGDHAAPKEKAPAPSAGSADVSAKVRAFQKEKGIATFAEAAEALYASNPDAFDEEGGAA
jgi:hypothetical protein